MSTTPTITTIDLLRHGQTEADNILRGRIDVPLSAHGYLQMQQRIAPYINPELPWQQLITSPLQRCAKFTEDLALQHDCDYHISDGFLEMDFGDWDGRPFTDIRAEDPELFSKVWQQPHRYHPPNGETFDVFSARISAAWNQLIEQYAGKHILLISHGGVIRALLGKVMQTPLTSLSRIEVPYACMSRIRIYQQPDSNDWPQLVFHNQH